MVQLLNIKKMGVFASLQDEGRFGYRGYGIPSSGPMDRVSYHFGNQILGNTRQAVSLELFVGGFTFEALTTQTYVITGAEALCFVNGESIPLWVSFTLSEGDELTIHNVTGGAIVYLSTSGGFHAPLTLGSRSSYLPAGIGEEMKQGTVLLGNSTEKKYPRRGLYPTFKPNFEQQTVRIFKGIHYELFTENSRQALLQQAYQFVGGNRMGYYFKGEPLTLSKEKEMLSEATQFGTIQVPASGQPIILMADAQTVGGYPVIGTIHPEDLCYVAQLKTYDKLRFILIEEVTTDGY